MCEIQRQSNFQQRASVVPWMAMASLLVLGLLAGCSVEGPRSQRSFAEIQGLVEGKSAADVTDLLGEPDTRQELFDADERWIWWSYTSLESREHPPEIRGRVVHLEIVFRNPSRASKARKPYSEWPIDSTFGVKFKLPSQNG